MKCIPLLLKLSELFFNTLTFLYIFYFSISPQNKIETSIEYAI